jgi:SAM-dependent methyltransferase
MDGAEQVAAYTQAGRIDGVMSAGYLFHSAHCSAVIQGARRVVDLGCGPATQLAQIAELNPGVEFTGVDLSEAMLERGRAYVAERGLGNVTLHQGDITDLSDYASGAFDAVISTLSLHHLPSHAHLQRCMREIGRVLAPGGAVYLADFGRLKSVKSVIFFAYLNADRLPHVFLLDFERSMRAAFLFEELRAVAAADLPPGVRAVGTFISPMLTILCTAPRPLPVDLVTRLRAMRAALPSRYRADLDDMRLFFRLGGLKGDPFR